MEKPKEMTAREARIWCMDHPSHQVLSKNSPSCRYYYDEFVGGFGFEHVFGNWTPGSCDITKDDPTNCFYVASEYDAWWQYRYDPLVASAKKEPERRSIEELAIEEHRLCGIDEYLYLGVSDRCTFKAIERYIEQRLAEVKL